MNDCTLELAIGIIVCMQWYCLLFGNLKVSAQKQDI